jgi:dihydrofolate reductase
MRKISLFMHVSLDGYCEGPNHDISFFKKDGEANAFFREQTNEGATMLFGHRTYELMKSWWPTQQAKKANPEIAKFMNEMPKVVVAHQRFEPGWNNVTVISGDVAGEVRNLKEQPGKHIVILGSNTLCVSLMQEGLVDEFQIMVNPVALGNGTSLFKGLPQKVDLKLLKTREFKSGNVLLTYEPVSK